MSRTRTAATELRIPRPRSPGHSVLLILTSDEATDAVRFAARAAAEQQDSLSIAMLTSGRHVGAPCMAALDHALLVARAEAPRLHVRVDTIPPKRTGGHRAVLVAEGLVVASPQTWSRLSEYARIQQSDETVVRLIEPDG